jgi:4-hydroxy-tetrahydrodipicolinate reductase
MTYASGAVRAAKWLRRRSAGLYDMFDVLDMK